MNIPGRQSTEKKKKCLTLIDGNNVRNEIPEKNLKTVNLFNIHH